MRRGVLWVLIAVVASVGPALWARHEEEGGSLPLRLLGIEPSGLTFDRDAVEFGSVFPGEVVAVEFEFVNASDEPVRIREAVSTCGCVLAEPSKRRFEPGESGVVRAQVYTDGRFGRQDLRIRVSTDESAHSAVLLRLRGHVRVVLRPDPYRVVLRGLEPEVEHSGLVRVFANEEIENPKVETRGAGLRAKLARVADREWEVRFTLRPAATTFGGVSVSARHKESGKHAEIWIPIVWSVAR
jgi:hypothetical protein